MNQTKPNQTKMTVVINELLCFLFNKYHKFNKLQLKSILLGFFSDVELCDAKEMLHNEAGKLVLENMRCAVKRSKGDNRARLLVDDLVDLCTFIDERAAVGRLPVYVDSNLDRVPTTKPEDVDM